MQRENVLRVCSYSITNISAQKVAFHQEMIMNEFIKTTPK